MTDAAESEIAIVRRLKAQNAALEEENGGLKRGGGGGTLPPMDIVDAKIAASEARTDVKFERMDGKLNLILEKLTTVQANSIDARSEARTTRRTIIGTGISLAAVMVALFALFTNGFNMGSKVADVSRQTFIDMSNSSAPALQTTANTPTAQATKLPLPASTPGHSGIKSGE